MLIECCLECPPDCSFDGRSSRYSSLLARTTPGQTRQMAVVLVLCVLIASRLAQSSTNQNGFRQVSLDVEERGSLTGPHCPGTVRLVCEGVDLTLLDWRYNTVVNSNSIHSFSPVSIPTFRMLSSPFILLVELISVSQSITMPQFANFSSVLVVDLSQLVQENVKHISCGNAVAVISTIPVDVTIINETIIEDPQITKVNTAQNSSDVQLTLQWEQQTVQGQGCTVNESLLVQAYTVTLLWNGINHTMTFNSSSCGVQCSVEFSIHSLERVDNYTVYLQAMNGVREISSVIHSGAIVECPAPTPPLNGSVDYQLSIYLLGTTLIYQCDLYPDDVQMTECRNVSGRGVWVPDPADLDCSEREKSDNLCTMPLANELEHGSLTRLGNISNGVLVDVRCDEGYTLSGSSTGFITCTATEGWSTDLEAIQCTDSSTVTSGLVIAITAGIGGGLLTIATVALLVIVIKCACSKYRKRGSSAKATLQPMELSAKKTGDEVVQLGMYSTLNHPGVAAAQADSAAETVVIYEEIGPPSTKPLSYADVSSHQLEESGTLPKPWSSVNYVTVEGSTEGEGASTTEPLPERKARDSYVDMARGVSALSELQAATVPDKVQPNATQLYGGVNMERRQTIVAVTDMKLKANKSYGMVEMQ